MQKLKYLISATQFADRELLENLFASAAEMERHENDYSVSALLRDPWA